VAARIPRDVEPLPLTIEFRAGVTLERQGEPSVGLRVLESGAASERIVSVDGREVTLAVLGPGDLVGEPNETPSATTVRVLRLVRLRTVTGSEASKLLAERSRRLARLAAGLGWLAVTDRVRERVEDLAARFGRPTPSGTQILLPITQEELAALACTTRESANRAVRSLADAGIVRVVGRGRYVIQVRGP